MYWLRRAVIVITAALLSGCGDSTPPTQPPPPPPPQLSSFTGKWIGETLNGQAFPVTLDSMLSYGGQQWTYTRVSGRDLVILQNGRGLWLENSTDADVLDTCRDMNYGPIPVSWTADDSTLHGWVQSVCDPLQWFAEDFHLRPDGKLEVNASIFWGTTVFRRDSATVVY